MNKNLFPILFLLPMNIYAEEIKYSCPKSIVVNQQLKEVVGNQFEVGDTSGSHGLKSGYVGYNNARNNVDRKASLIYKTIGVSADERSEDESVYTEKYTIDKAFFSENKVRFYCVYEDTSVTLSIVVPPDSKQCTLSIEERDPSINKDTTVKFSCFK